MSRAQIGIDRLPARRMSEQPREAMNCKSCRKRKIKCNRLRPACEACQVFACPCIYDAVPKKRGPKTDVLEALLKRVDGLEKRLRSEGKDDSANAPVSAVKEAILEAVRCSTALEAQEKAQEAPREDSANSSPNVAPANSNEQETKQSSPLTSHPNSIFANSNYAGILIDTYFSRINGKPYYILDESSTRQRYLTGQLPSHLSAAIFAVSAKYASNYGGYDAAARNARDYARRARAELDIDEPTIEGIQTLLLLTQAMYQEGSGKKAYMHLAAGVSMALALDLHHEIQPHHHVTPTEREGRRRLFWSCYLLDRISACGSKRPSLISDESIALRLPTGSLQTPGMAGEGDFFPTTGPNLQHMGGPGAPGLSGQGMLIGIARILGNTNRYLAVGGVKGDSHFPWHSLSNLSKIRHDLDLWASETQAIFTSVEALFGQPDSTVMLLAKLIYHLIHCLIYRPFLPVDLAELSRTSQHQSWQIEATNLCFLHANAIAEMVELGKNSSFIDRPAFVSYCVCTAGTIHVHGAHYQGRPGEVYSMSADFLSRELQHLADLQYIWGGMKHQRTTLQALYGAHSELVKSLASNPIRFSPVFQMEDFFDRYPGYSFDTAHVKMGDNADELVLKKRQRATSQQNRNANMHPGIQQRAYTDQMAYSQFQQHVNSLPSSQQPPKKRRATYSHIDPARPISPNSQNLVPATFNGIPSSDTYQSPYPTGTAAPQTSFPPPPHPNHSLATPETPKFSFDGVELNSSDASRDPNARRPSYNGQSLVHGHCDPMLSMPASQYETNEGNAPDFSAPHAQQPHFSPSAAMDGIDHAQGLGISMAAGGQAQDEADPFLSLLEQLAENEQSRGGPSELGTFLNSLG